MNNPHPESTRDVHFRLKPETYRHLKGVAKALDRSVAYLCAKIVREWMVKEEHDENTQPR